MTEKTEPYEKKFRCSYCGFQADTFNEMDKHQQNNHRGDLEKPDQPIFYHRL